MLPGKDELLSCFPASVDLGMCGSVSVCRRQIIWPEQEQKNQEKVASKTNESGRWAERAVSSDWQLQFTCQHQKRFRFVPLRSTELHWNTMLNLTIHCISHIAPHPRICSANWNSGCMAQPFGPSVLLVVFLMHQLRQGLLNLLSLRTDCHLDSSPFS